MSKRKLAIIFPAILGCSLILAVAGLIKVRANLKKTESERDALKADMVRISQSFENARSELAAVMKARDELKDKVTQLQERVENLHASVEQLQDKLKKEAEEVVNSKLYGVVFTTGINEKRNLPENDLDKISINEETIYVFCKWRLSLGEHTYKIKIFDGSGELVHEADYEVVPTEHTWNTWRGYYINKYVDKPGQWRCEVYLDGRKAGEKHLTVLAEDEGSSIEQLVPE